MATASDGTGGATAATVQPRPRVALSRRRRRPSGEPPPLPRGLNRTSVYWLTALGVLAGTSILVALAAPGAGVVIDVADHRLLSWFSALRTPALSKVMQGFGWFAHPRPVQGIWLANVAVLIVFRRWRHLFVWVGATLTVIAVTDAVAYVVQRPHPYGIEILGPWVDFSMPSLPVAVLCSVLVNTMYSVLPQGRIRQYGKLVATILVALVVCSRLYLAQDNPSDALVGILIGVTIPLVAFRLLLPSDIFPVTYRRGRTAHIDITGARDAAIRRALEDQLGVIPVEIHPFGLEGSGGSTPLRVKIKGDPDTYIFAKLYTATHLRSDRWYKLGRTLLYGGLEDEKAFNSVRRLVQYEDYALRVLKAAELPVPEPYGIVEITPEREYLLVMAFFAGAHEIGDPDVTVDDSIIDQAFVIVQRLWHAGLAHRDIKPANLLVRDGRLLLIDSAFAEVRPSPWRQAVDLANMMLVLALRTDCTRVYERALRFFSVDEIAEAFAATRGLTMPSQLRRLIRGQGRDLHTEFKRLLPYPVRPIAIQRWSFRRVALSIAVLLVCLLVFLVAQPLLLRSPL
jgi:tRNA A-37 threonylcarbamoyl transferase component Bud32/membrane-associated phospholipid phosphatase